MGDSNVVVVDGVVLSPSPLEEAIMAVVLAVLPFSAFFFVVAVVPFFSVFFIVVVVSLALLSASSLFVVLE